MTEIIRVSRFLRFVLSADAVTGVFCGLLLAAGGGALENLLGLPRALTFYAGLSLFPFVALLLYAATRRSVSKTVIWLVVGINLLWTADSFLLLASGYVAPTAAGTAFVIAQALGVFVFAALQFAGLRNAEVVVFKDARETL